MDEAERCSHIGYIYMSRMIVLGRPDELKADPAVTPQGTRRFELTCARPAAALAKARPMPQIRDATMFGDRLHLLVQDDLAPENLLALLTPDEPQAAIRPIAPTLEDVFVLLSRGEAARAAEVAA